MMLHTLHQEAAAKVEGPMLGSTFPTELIEGSLTFLWDLREEDVRLFHESVKQCKEVSLCRRCLALLEKERPWCVC